MSKKFGQSSSSSSERREYATRSKTKKPPSSSESEEDPEDAGKSIAQLMREIDQEASRKMEAVLVNYQRGIDEINAKYDKDTEQRKEKRKRDESLEKAMKEFESWTSSAFTTEASAGSGSGCGSGIKKPLETASEASGSKKQTLDPNREFMQFLAKEAEEEDED
jgi:hypothetical protein